MGHVCIGKTLSQIKNWHLFRSRVLASQAASPQIHAVGGTVRPCGRGYTCCSWSWYRLQRTPNVPRYDCLPKPYTRVPGDGEATSVTPTYVKGRWACVCDTNTAVPRRKVPGAVWVCAMWSVAAFLRRCLPSSVRSPRSALCLGILQRVWDGARGAGLGVPGAERGAAGRSRQRGRLSPPTSLDFGEEGETRKLPAEAVRRPPAFQPAACSTSKSTEAGARRARSRLLRPPHGDITRRWPEGVRPKNQQVRGIRRAARGSCSVGPPGGRLLPGDTAARSGAPPAASLSAAMALGAPSAHAAARGSEGRIAAPGKEGLTWGIGTAEASLAVLFSRLPFLSMERKKKQSLWCKRSLYPCAPRNEMSVQCLGVAAWLLAVSSGVPSQGSADAQLLPALRWPQETKTVISIPVCRKETRSCFSRISSSEAKTVFPGGLVTEFADT